MDHGDLRDRRLSAPFWPEPVRILRVEPLGPAYEVLAEGLQSGQLHRILTSTGWPTKKRLIWGKGAPKRLSRLAPGVPGTSPTWPG
jgi:hypothetical protein